MELSRVGNHFIRNLAAKQYSVVWEKTPLTNLVSADNVNAVRKVQPFS